MKAVTLPKLTGVVLPAIALGAVLLVGCQSTPKVDWSSRVGSYTYDQAVAELGPPDKVAKLSDGRSVADWLTRRSGGSALSLGVGGFGSRTGVGVSQTVGTGRQDRVLRLTFGADGKLLAWLRN